MRNDCDEYNKLIFINWINSAISDAHDDQKIKSIPGYCSNFKEFKTAWKACHINVELVFDICNSLILYCLTIIEYIW